MREYNKKSKGFIMSYIKINENKCKSCYLCIDVCPKKLIKKSDKKNSLGENLVCFDNKKNECIACAQCALVCPEIAIEQVVKE